MVVIVIVILRESFIQDFSTVTTSLILMLRMSSSTDSSISATQIKVENDELDTNDKLVEKLSKSWRIV